MGITSLLASMARRFQFGVGHYLRLVLILNMLMGCASDNDNISRQVTRIDRAVEDARAEVILSNIARASEYDPLSFTAVTAVQGQRPGSGLTLRQAASQSVNSKIGEWASGC